MANGVEVGKHSGSIPRVGHGGNFQFTWVVDGSEDSEFKWLHTGSSLQVTGVEREFVGIDFAFGCTTVSPWDGLELDVRAELGDASLTVDFLTRETLDGGEGSCTFDDEETTLRQCVAPRHVLSSVELGSPTRIPWDAFQAVSPLPNPIRVS